MTLPCTYRNQRSSQNSFNDYIQYFIDSITFLRENEWIFNFPNTDVLVHNIFEKFPKGWRYHLEKLSCKELNEIPFGLRQDTWPCSLNDFVARAALLKPSYVKIQATNQLELPKNFSRGLNPKKQHEISVLANYIHQKCEKKKITTIIDVGAGLGYISHLLHELYGYKILGIESEASRVESALKRQNKYYPNSINFVKFIQHFVSEKSPKEIDNALTTWLGPDFTEHVCLIGLHACADLTITSLHIFQKLDYIKQVIIMPCCYHKLEMSLSRFNREPQTATDEYFTKFPLSDALSNIYLENEGYRYFRRPFLRVACQSSPSVWRLMTEEEHRQHSISHMRRALLQYFVTTENYSLTKLKRKCMNRLTASNCDFETYLKQLDEGYYLTVNPTKNEPGAILKDYGNVDGERNENLKFTSSEIKNKLYELWERYEKELNMIEILAAFQNTIQSICENIILLDRVVFMKEKGFEAMVEKVTDDEISPRCLALVAFK